MRTFGTFLAVGILAAAAGCGGGSGGGTNSNGRNTVTGMCAKDSCAAMDTFLNCVEKNCAAQVTAAYGSGYASGTFSGPCAQLQTCLIACSCGTTSTTCEDTCNAQYKATGSACATADDAVTACGSSLVMAGTCTYAACPVTGTATSTLTSTSTITNTATTTTTTTTATSTSTATGSCAQAVTCCNSLMATGAVTQAECTMLATLGDAGCSSFLTSIQSSGFCK